MTLLVILLPLLSCLFCIFFGYKLGRLGSIYISICSIVSTAILAFVLFYKVALLHTVITLSIFPWLVVEFFSVQWTFLFDSLSVTMLIVVTLVSCVVHLYSTSYMSEDPQLPRFLAYLSLFTFFMLILITSNNFLQLFMGWEGVGLCSYLLISFWYTRIAAGKAAMKAIVLNRLGDCGLLLAIFIIFLTFRSVEFPVIWPLVPFFSQYTFIFLNYEFNILNLIACFLLIAAIGKSAQLGLHTWLPDAMEGPTPVSALIHAATMVTAGVFLIIRCSAIFEYAPTVLLLMAIIGSLTSIFAASAAIVQHDIKKTIAYSTCSQLGYMVFCCALSNYPTGLYHLVTHAFFKALLFLSAGAVIHALMNEQDIRKMGGLVKLIPFTYIMMLIGSLALGGFPFLAGFYSKDLILETTLQTNNYFQYFVIITSFVTAFLTAYYSFRTIYLVFLASSTVYKSTGKKIHDVPPVMAIALFILSIGSLFSGYYFFDMFVGLGTDLLENSIFIRMSNANTCIAIEYLSPLFKQIAPFYGFVGIILSIYFLKWYGNFLTFYKSVYRYSSYKFLIHKWYFDNIYSTFSKYWFNFNYDNFYKLLDKGIFEFFGPRGATLLIFKTSDIFVRTQSGYIWHYMSLMSIFLLVVAFLFI